MRQSAFGKTQVRRRTLLQGAGVAMSLPWLESIPVWGIDNSVTTPGAAFPNRFGVLFMACGIHPDHWWAKGSGAEMELSQSLQPLEPVKQKVNVIQGLFNKSSTGVGIHPGQTGNILSGASLQKGAELRGGISVDQVLANQLGQETAQPSMVLGCEQPITGYHETNFSMAYSSHISWQNATSPVPMEVYPSLAFDSLFDNRGNRRNQSVLDRVREHASSLSRQASVSDRSKLEDQVPVVLIADILGKIWETSPDCLSYDWNPACDSELFLRPSTTKTCSWQPSAESPTSHIVIRAPMSVF